MRALVITYHCIEAGPAPLCVDPALFGRHLDVLAAAGARTLTASELAARLRAGDLPDRAVALTFDDGFDSVVRSAAPLLAERGMTATVFCVAGRLGADNGWPSQGRASRVPRRRLADADEVRALIELGFEAGAHGMHHAPLDSCPAGELERELVEARAVLERDVGAEVRSLAYPYGARPSPAAERIVRAEYASAFTTRLAAAGPGDDPFAIPRIDAHYLRHPEVLRRALCGTLEPYLAARRVAARVRRALRSDHA